MELRTLHYFLTVAREQSISAAAESLHISQPALSTQMKAMEEELGKQLLIRGTKGSRRVVLTDEGMILRRRAEEILSLVQKAEEEIAHSDETIVGDVVIGAGETDNIRLLARVAKGLQMQYPDIHYHITSGNAEYVLEYLDTVSYTHLPHHEVLAHCGAVLHGHAAGVPTKLRGDHVAVFQHGIGALPQGLDAVELCLLYTSPRSTTA